MEEGKEGKEEMIVMQTGTGYVVMLIKFILKIIVNMEVCTVNINLLKTVGK